VPPAEPLDLGDDEQPHSHADYGANGPRAADVDRTQDAPSEQAVSVRISCVVCS
jgi:hypothetical protein